MAILKCFHVQLFFFTHLWVVFTAKNNTVDSFFLLNGFFLFYSELAVMVYIKCTIYHQLLAKAGYDCLRPLFIFLLHLLFYTPKTLTAHKN